MSEETFDFDSPVNRHGTGSLKWQKFAGRDVLPMWVADMDFVSPPAVLEALRARLEHGVFGYTVPYVEVEEAACAYLRRVHGLSTEPSELVWVPGLVPALNVVCRAFAQPGDAVMTATPVYPPFLTAPKNQHCELITNHLVLQDGRWTFDFEQMEQSVTPQTKVFILCQPHNPVGRVFDREELLALCDFCQKHDLVLVSDEIHCDLVLDEAVEHVSTATLDHPMRDRIITLMAPSKTYNIPGLACAYAVIQDSKLRMAFNRAKDGFLTEVNAFGYAGCAAAYNHGEPWRKALIQYLRANREFLYQTVSEQLPAITMHPMQATYLAWLDIRKLDLKDAAAHFEEHGVGLSDGRFFGDANYVRLNFGCPRAQLEEALSRMIAALS